MQTIRIICVALVFSSVVMIEFRILGYTKSGTVAETARRFVPWIFVCVVVMALTGTVLAAKVAGAVSILLWVGVIYFSRMTGFTMVQGGA